MIGRWGAALGRASLEPALVRLGALAASLVALLVALPAGLPPLLLAAVGVLAVLPALAPRGPWVTVVVLASVAGWLADTGLPVVAGTGTGDRVPDPGRLLVLAGALYLLHTLAALAATLPYDTVVAPEVTTRWLLRALAVVVVSALLSVAVMAGLSGLAADRTYAAAGLAGLAVAVATAGLLARSPRTR